MRSFPMTRVIVLAGVLGAMVMVAVVAIGTTSGPNRVDVLRPDDKQVTELGRQIYAAHCSACHGVRLEGQPNWRQRDAQGRLPAPPHDASGHTWHHRDDVLFQITKVGVANAAKLSSYESSMPVYEGVLTDAEIVAVLSWIKAQWPADIRAKHDEMNRSSPQRR